MRSVTIWLMAVLVGGSALADDSSDHTENRLDERGDRIDERLDHRGDQINDRLDARSEHASNEDRNGAARRLDRRGNRVEQRLDRRGNRINDRWDRRSERISDVGRDRPPRSLDQRKSRVGSANQQENRVGHRIGRQSDRRPSNAISHGGSSNLDTTKPLTGLASNQDKSDQ